MSAPGSSPGSSPHASGVPPLSPGEREVLVLLARGHTVEAVTARLGISVRTVGRREAGLRTRLGVGSRMAAAAEAAAASSHEMRTAMIVNHLPGYDREDGSP